MTMTLSEYRVRCQTAHRNGWDEDFAELLKNELRDLRWLEVPGWYSSALIFGPSVLRPIYNVIAAEVDQQSEREPSGKAHGGEVVFAGNANLFSCCGYPDYTHRFKHRLSLVRTDRNGMRADWHHSKMLAAVALREKKVYWGPLNIEVGFAQPIPFTPGELHGFNPQSLLRHLAAGMENGASIYDVWPAFRECVFNFPVKSAPGGDFDGTCLFWIARIVHHHIGRQPLGETAAWLHRHFNAWADGNDLPPLGELAAV
jgi:hypothetical protein